MNGSEFWTGLVKSRVKPKRSERRAEVHSAPIFLSHCKSGTLMHPEFLSVGAATQASLVRLALGASQNYAAGAITSHLSTHPALVAKHFLDCTHLWSGTVCDMSNVEIGHGDYIGYRKMDCTSPRFQSSF
ncbi:unnamed protein product [Durusdinium trenchii]|uniref:Uncharacterized protein n=1 Tax=Durusdinium trenchii TaxID=1381693 RepID=A0ABP0HAG8_9DINO